MGLTISYTLRFNERSIEDVRDRIEQLRKRALDLPFKKVGDILDLSGPECDFQQCRRDDPNHWLLIQARHMFEQDNYGYEVVPTRLIAFSTWPGEGSEPANFGLCRYPATIKDHDGKAVKTGLGSGWSWWSFCKTQYSSNPGLGGMENFLRCHLTVIRLLDQAKELGILKEVSDEGGFWEKRDVKALVEEVTHWNAGIAGLVGQMKDLLGGRDMHSEITKFPNYEHLEAKGRAEEGEDDGYNATGYNNRRVRMMTSLADKLNPSRFDEMSPFMAAVVGYVLGESFSTPEIAEITVSESENLVYVRQSGAIGFDGILSLEDFRNNWNRLLDAAELTAEERREAVGLFTTKIKTLPGTEV